MGFYITDETQDRGPRAAKPPWGPKPSRGPIREVISGLRFYNPSLGRWINRDPIGERGGVNIYAFVVNRPIGLFDILGLTEAGDSCSCEELEEQEWTYAGSGYGDDSSVIVTHWLYENVGTKELDVIIDTASKVSSLVDFMTIIQDLGVNPALVYDMTSATSSTLAWGMVKSLVNELKESNAVRVKMRYQCLRCKKRFFGLFRPKWKKDGKERIFECTAGSLGRPRSSLEGVYDRRRLDEAIWECTKQMNSMDVEELCGEG